MTDAFTTAEAYDHGYGRGALRGRSVRRELHGLYVPAWADDRLLTRVEAARRVLPGNVQPDGVTVLQLLDVPVGAEEPLRIVTAHPHQPQLESRRAGTRGGPLLSCARVDSVQETRLRLALVLAGLPEPDVNPTVRAEGRLVGRVDLLLRRWRVVIEYEGDQHRRDRTQWHRDVWRQERPVEDDHTLVRVTAERMRSPRTVVLTVHQALVERGYVGPAPVFGPEWRTLFATAH